MMDGWGLPHSAKIGGMQYHINADFRDILQILTILNNESNPEIVRWQIAITLFYDGDIPTDYIGEAIQYLAGFINYEIVDDKPLPKMIDWEQDSRLIIAEVNKVAGQEIRSLPFVHWWTFLSWFCAIGDGRLATVVSIRIKNRRHQKLEKWEREYYNENKRIIDFQTPDTPEKAAIKEYFDKWL